MVKVLNMELPLVIYMMLTLQFAPALTLTNVTQQIYCVKDISSNSGSESHILESMQGRNFVTAF